MPRQTGKTEHLIYEFIRDPWNSFFITINRGMVERVYERSINSSFQPEDSRMIRDYEVERQKECTEWYKDVPEKWKHAIIKKAMNDNTGGFPVDMHPDVLYDEAIYHLSLKTTRRITNLAKKLGYEEIPCYTCRMMIKHWDDNDEYKWNPSTAHHFK